MANLKRYSVYFHDHNPYIAWDMQEVKNGEWVKFEDIKELLNTSTDKHSTKSLKEIIQLLRDIRPHLTKLAGHGRFTSRIDEVLDGI